MPVFILAIVELIDKPHTLSLHLLTYITEQVHIIAIFLQFGKSSKKA